MTRGIEVAEDLGRQAEIQEAINKSLQDRIALLEKQNNLLKNQSQLQSALKDLDSQRSQSQRDTSASMTEAAEKAAEQAGSEKENMEEQLSMAEKLRQAREGTNKALEDAANKQKEYNNDLEGAAEAWDDAKKNAKKFFKDAIKKAGPAGAAIVGMVRGVKDIARAFKGLGGLLTSVVGGIFSIGKALIAAPFQIIKGIATMYNNAAGSGQALRDATEKVRESFGSLSSGLGGSVMKSFKAAQKAAKNFGDTGRSVSSIYGYGADGQAALLEDMTDTAAGLEKAMAGLTLSLGKRGLERLTAFKKGMGLTGDEMGILAKNARLSGQDMDEMIARVGRAAEGMGAKFGIPAKMIAKDIATMKADFVNFGHMAETEMAGVSAYAKKMGVEVKDLSAVMDKYMSFEGAAESVSALNQAFGMQIDTMKMMSAQNPAEQVEQLRQSFFATGRTIENMTIQEKKLLQAQTGMSDAMLQSAFSAENAGMSYEDMAKQAEEDEKKKLDQTEVLQNLAEALKKFTGMGQQLQGVGDAFSKGFMLAVSKHPEMKALMKTTMGFLKTVKQFGYELGNLTMDILGKTGIFKAISEILDSKAFIVFKDDILQAFRELGEWLFSDDEGTPDSIIDKFGAAFTKLGDAKAGPIKKLGTAIEKIGQVMFKLIEMAAQKAWPHIKKGFQTMGELLDKHSGDIMAFLWPVIKYIFAWVLLKGLVYGIGVSLITKGIPLLGKGLAKMFAKGTAGAGVMAAIGGGITKMVTAIGAGITKAGAAVKAGYAAVAKGGVRVLGKGLSMGQYR